MVCIFVASSAASFRHSLIVRKLTNSFSIVSLYGVNAPDGMEEEIGVSEGIIEVPTKNVLGGRLQACCFQPKTGFYRVSTKQTGIWECLIMQYLLQCAVHYTFRLSLIHEY